MVEHRCHAPGCKTAAAPGRPFCRAHWRLLPPPVRNRIASGMDMAFVALRLAQQEQEDAHNG